MKRTTLIIECACVLLLCAAGGCLSHLWKNGPLTLDIASTALIVPAIATTLFLCVSFGIPDLYAVDGLRFPLNVTLPVVYGATLVLTMILISRVGPSIVKVSSRLEAINVWANGWVLATTILAGVVCLSVLGFLERDRAS
ncbi:MAG TPA: hypothetical protein VHE55_06350 [Fimbriimonadaceae bacterium]|nr:hypothetical protein [Fimbriimonadaceae bacterium]